jgi:hypothetical protein
MGESTGESNGSSKDNFEAVHRASYILRCWTDTVGGVRVRLIDARSGVSYPLARLADLPDLVRRLLLRSPPLPNEFTGGDTLREGR